MRMGWIKTASTKICCRPEIQDLVVKRFNIIKARKLRNIFYCEDISLTFTSETKHRIRAFDSVPVYEENYRYPKEYKQKVKRQIEKMWKDGIIKPNTSPWNSH